MLLLTRMAKIKVSFPIAFVEMLVLWDVPTTLTAILLSIGQSTQARIGTQGQDALALRSAANNADMPKSPFAAMASLNQVLFVPPVAHLPHISITLFAGRKAMLWQQDFHNHKRIEAFNVQAWEGEDGHRGKRKNTSPDSQAKNRRRTLHFSPAKQRSTPITQPGTAWPSSLPKSAPGLLPHQMKLAAFPATSLGLDIPLHQFRNNSYITARG